MTSVKRTLKTGPLTLPAAIGHLILNFSAFEMQVMACLQASLPDELEMWRQRHLKEKLERLARHIAQTKPQQEAFDRFLTRLAPVRELRNHIAHGYLQATVPQDGAQPVVGIVQAKDFDGVFDSKTRHLALSDIRAALSELDALTIEFDDLTSGYGGFKADR